MREFFPPIVSYSSMSSCKDPAIISYVLLIRGHSFGLFMDLTKEDLEGFDAIFDAFGSAGSLYLDKTHTVQVKGAPNFPPEYLPLATMMGKALDALRKVTDVDWTYISPAGDFQTDVERTGKYVLSGEEFTLNSKGENIISYADYAIGMVDAIEDGSHVHSILGSHDFIAQEIAEMKAYQRRWTIFVHERQHLFFLLIQLGSGSKPFC